MTQKIAEQGEAVRGATVKLLDEMRTLAADFELPAFPAALEHYRSNLLTGDYKVLVVGEAKRGKSSFINALIGRDCLPTDVDIATSQVFKITRADREAYRLRFEDDSCKEIAAEDLPRYGSQVVADREGLPGLGETIRWIEVDVPARFLPDGVSILDTPGVGGLYAAHAQITNRFVPQADAVIFVLDSERPVIQEELEFVDAILEVTLNLFFIQTKIDAFDREHWGRVMERNRDILAARFGERLPAPRVWPVSSRNLRNAAAAESHEDAELYLMISRHGELSDALRAFLLKVAGWGRSSEAVILAERYHASSSQTLAARAASLSETSDQTRTQAQTLAARRKQEFEENWGERGQKKRELLEGVRKVVAISKQSFRQALQPGGALEEAQKRRVAALTTQEEATQLGEQITADLLAEVEKVWRQTCVGARARCLELLAPFVEEADSLAAPAPEGVEGLEVAERPKLEFEERFLKKLKSASWEFGQLTTILGLAVTLSAGVLAPIIGLGGGLIQLWAIVHGWKSVDKKEVETAKRQLFEHLEASLKKVRSYFFDVEPGATSFCRVEETLGGLEATLLGRVQGLVAQKLEEARAEIARLQEASRLDEQQRKAMRQRVVRQKAAWAELGQRLAALRVQLVALDNSLTERPAAAPLAAAAQAAAAAS